MKTCKVLLPALLCTLLPLAGYAQDDGTWQFPDTTHIVTERDAYVQPPTTRQHFIAIGTANILDTYLSSEEYTGAELRYIYRIGRQMKKPRWQQFLQLEGDMRGGHNRADNANVMGVDFRLRDGRLYSVLNDASPVTLQVGATADFLLGVLYNTRNQNNPAQMRLALTISPMVSVSYPFHIKRMQLKAGWEVSAPLVGLMFSPNYGQSYYEIFTRNNYDHNLVLTTIGSTPSVQSMLTISTSLKNIGLTLGYLAEAQQSHVNNLKTHIWNHMLVVGFTRKITIINHRL